MIISLRRYDPGSSPDHRRGRPSGVKPRACAVKPNGCWPREVFPFAYTRRVLRGPCRQQVAGWRWRLGGGCARASPSTALLCPGRLPEVIKRQGPRPIISTSLTRGWPWPGRPAPGGLCPRRGAGGFIFNSKFKAHPGSRMTELKIFIGSGRPPPSAGSQQLPGAQDRRPQPGRPPGFIAIDGIVAAKSDAHPRTL